MSDGRASSQSVATFRRADWLVDTLALEQGVQLVTDEHYARGAANTATFRHGLYRRETWPFSPVGAALWIPPTRAAAEATWPDNWQGVLSLSRFVIAPDTPTNAASFLLGRSIRLIRRDPRWECLVTYADEWQGHTGIIYRATNWVYAGLTKPERVYVDGNGRMVARKAGPKTRTHADMLELGCRCVGSFAKHKFTMPLRVQTAKVAA